MTDLSVSVQSLQSGQDQLNSLASDIETTTNLPSWQESSIGANELIKALHDFETDWSAKRKSLLDSISSVTKMLGDAHSTYTGADGSLATAANKMGGGS